MKLKIILLIALTLGFQNLTYAQSNTVEEIRNVIDGHEASVENYHYARLKGFLEGLGLANNFFQTTGNSEQENRMVLVALKMIFKSIKTNYPELPVTKIIKTIHVNRAVNTLGRCALYNNQLKDGQLEISIRDFNGAKFNEYTMPVIRSCTQRLLKQIESTLE